MLQGVLWAVFTVVSLLWHCRSLTVYCVVLFSLQLSNLCTVSDEDESAALLGLILLLTQTLSNRQHHRASMALTEWSCVAFHAPFADTQLSIFFHALRCACACMSASCAGYAKTSLLNQIARKAATWMATTKNVLAFKNLPKSYSEQSTTAFKSAGKNGSGEFQTPTTPQQRMLLVQILNRYLHMMGEPFMTLKRTVHRLYQKQKKDNFTMLKKYNATSSNDTCDENKKMDIQMGIFGKLRLAHFVSPPQRKKKDGCVVHNMDVVSNHSLCLSFFFPFFLLSFLPSFLSLTRCTPYLKSKCCKPNGKTCCNVKTTRGSFVTTQELQDCIGP